MDSNGSDEQQSFLRNAAGKECIYEERRTIVHATIEHVHATDRALMVTLRDRNTPGFVPPDSFLGQDYTGRFTVGVARECGRFDEHEWHGSLYCQWTVLLHETLVAALCAFALRIQGRDPRRRIKLLRQKLFDIQHPPDGSVAERIAARAGDIANRILAGELDYPRGACMIADVFERLSEEDSHPDFAPCLDLARRISDYWFIPPDWRKSDDEGMKRLRGLVLPGEDETMAAIRRLAERGGRQAG